VVLVDTPGTGDFNSHVAVAAEGAIKGSSAYVLITTYEALQITETARFIGDLHKYDQGVFEDRRLIIVVTKFDQTNPPYDTDPTSVETVYKKVCELVSKACPDATIRCDDVLPLSGLWAFSAQMLMSHTCGPEHNYRRMAEQVLSQYQSVPCGEDESKSSCLTKKKDDELAKKLLSLSKFGSLKARIQSVTKSCIKVWASKMKSDYDRYLKAAKTKLRTQYDSEKEEMNSFSNSAERKRSGSE